MIYTERKTIGGICYGVEEQVLRLMQRDSDGVINGQGV